MKTFFVSMSALAVAAITLISCNKIDNSIDAPERSAIPFEFTATNSVTKTTNDGVHTNWKADDGVNLFHAIAGSTSYTSDGKFTAAENGSAVKFTGTLASELTADNYDWYAIYPYTSSIATPANTTSPGYVIVGQQTNKVQKQTGNNSMTHISGSNYPVAGIAENIPKATKPEISMSHLTSLIEVNVTNGTESPITVTDITFTGTEDIVGTFYIDFVSSPVGYTSSGASYTGTTATLQVVGGSTIAKDASAKFYLAVKPFTAPKDATLTLAVTADNGEQSKDLVLSTSAVTFAAGTKNTLNFTYNKAAAPAETWKLTALADITSSDVFVIVGTNATSSYAMSNNNSTSSAPTAVEIETETYSGGTKLKNNPGATIKWHLSKDGSNYTFYPGTSGTSTWLYCTNTNNGVRVGTNDTNQVFVVDSGYLKNSATSRYVGVYNNADWRCYTSNGGNIAGQTFTFYVLQ